MKEKYIIRLVKWLTTFLTPRGKGQLFWFLEKEQREHLTAASNRAFFAYWHTPLSDSSVDQQIKKWLHHIYGDKLVLDLHLEKCSRIRLFEALARSTKLTQDERNSFMARVQEYNRGSYEIRRRRVEEAF